MIACGCSYRPRRSPMRSCRAADQPSMAITHCVSFPTTHTHTHTKNTATSARRELSVVGAVVRDATSKPRGLAQRQRSRKSGRALRCDDWMEHENNLGC